VSELQIWTVCPGSCYQPKKTVLPTKKHLNIVHTLTLHIRLAYLFNYTNYSLIFPTSVWMLISRLFTIFRFNCHCARTAFIASKWLTQIFMKIFAVDNLQSWCKELFSVLHFPCFRNRSGIVSKFYLLIKRRAMEAGSWNTTVAVYYQQVLLLYLSWIKVVARTDHFHHRLLRYIFTYFTT